MKAEEQAVFKASRSTVNHLFHITQLIEEKFAVDQKVHFLFVDLKKANDSIPQSKLWNTLKQTNINLKVIKTVKNYTITLPPELK